MKILTRKKQDEILKRLSANEIIAFSGLSIDGYFKYLDNHAEIVYAIGGIKGLESVSGMLGYYLKEREAE